MRKLAKRATVLLLAAVLLLSLLPAAHASNSVKEFQDAIVATAMAYYYKGAYVQYDSADLTAQSRLSHGESRISSGNPPEWAADDNTLFTVCSDFAYTVVYNACGYKLMGGSRKCITLTMAEDLDPKATPGVVFSTGGKSGTYDPQAALESEKLLQPGDIVTYYNANKTTGHAVIFVGDYFGDGKKYFCNANGKKIDLKTGADAIEKEKNSLGGAVRMDDYSVLFYEKGAFAYVGDPDAVTSFSILRPAKVAADLRLSLTDAAKTRLAFPGIGVQRETSVKKYQSVLQGDTIKVTLTLKNNGKNELKGISVSEAAPVGAEIVPAELTSGCVASAQGVTGKINLAAGETATVEYEIKVTAKQGETVTVPAGKVENLTTRELTFRVGGMRLDAAQVQRTGGEKALLSLEYDGDLDYANAVYRHLFGVELNLPKTIQELRDMLETWKPVPGVSEKTFGGQMLCVKQDSELSEDALRLKKMMIPEHQAGWAVFVREDTSEIPETLGAIGRTVEIKEMFYQPGDIFFGYVHENGTNLDVYHPDVYVYIGGGKAVGFTANPKNVKVTAFAKSIGLLLREDVLFAMRPSLVLTDADAKAAAKLPFTDVKSSDWFYSFVNELYFDKVISGMNATTFAPGGTLTYGQALKLLVAAIDKDVGNASSGHWASNYLKAAQDKGWISGSVNLDAPISRLNFCKVAAKAKGLTAQPASNPFTDTADTDVLALVNAGVINGMSATTFQPDSTLTRAQISKIISLLRKL